MIVDVDECKGDNDCEYTCINTVGGFECSCPVGTEGTGHNCIGLFTYKNNGIIKTSMHLKKHLSKIINSY